MAIDASIPLAGRFPDFGKTFRNALITGQNLREAYDTKDVRKQLMEQRAQIQEQALSNNAEDRKRMAVLGTLKALRQMDPAKRDLLAPSLQNSLKEQKFMGEDDSFLDDPYQDDAWLDANITALEPQAKGNGGFQKTATGMQFKDSQGNVFQANTVFDPQKGTFDPVITPVNPDGPQQPIGELTVAPDGLTMDERIDETERTTRARIQQENSQEIAKDSWNSLRAANSSILTTGEAIRAIDAGAATGPVEQWFPTFRQSTLELMNVGRRMGLDVISGGKFGPLSEGEMNLAMETALPTGMQEDELKDWLLRRQQAQLKLAEELSRAVRHFEAGGSMAEYLKTYEMGAPSGIEERVWNAMTPEERMLFK